MVVNVKLLYVVVFLAAFTVKKSRQEMHDKDEVLMEEDSMLEANVTVSIDLTGPPKNA